MESRSENNNDTQRYKNRSNKLKHLSKYFKLFHLNTRLMTSSFNEFQIFLKEHPFHFIFLSEIRYFGLYNYTWLLFLAHNKDKKRGAGVGAYLKENTKFKQIKDYREIDTTIENVWKEILNKENRPFLIGTLYQPGSNPRAKLP